MEISVEISEEIFDLPGRAHNLAGKEALRDELVRHHRERIPLHFRQNARDRYRYKKRSDVYLAIKRRKTHSTTDLVYSGATKSMVRGLGMVRIGGTMTGSTYKNGAKAGQVRAEAGLSGHLVMQIPFSIGYRDSADPSRVHSADIADEITRVRDDEEREMAAGFERTYMRRLEYYGERGQRRRRIFGARK